MIGMEWASGCGRDFLDQLISGFEFSTLSTKDAGTGTVNNIQSKSQGTYNLEVGGGGLRSILLFNVRL